MLEFLENSRIFKYITVDTEGMIPEAPLGMSLANPALQSMYFPLNHIQPVNIDEETNKYLFETIRTIPYRIMHNAGHDLMVQPIKKLFDLPFVCTMIMGHMVDENVMSKALDYMHKYYCGGEGKIMHPLMASIIKTHGWHMVPIELMYEYADNDALITMELFQVLKPKYEAQFGPLWSENEKS